MEEEHEVVKVFLLDGSHKSAHVNPHKSTVEELWEIIGDKLGLTIEMGVNFFIWGAEDDLELLLYSDQTIQEVRREWPKWYQQYSNKKTKKGTGFKFLFKPTCIVPLRNERNAKSIEGTHLFYIQAVHNVVNSYYPCDLNAAISLGGLQAYITLGDRNPQAHKPGYLKYPFAIYVYVPEHLQKQKPVEEWERLIYDEQEKHNGKDKYITEMLYLQLVRQWPYYGSTFFRATYKPNTQGFFSQEFNGDIVIGINGYGIHLIDPIVMKVISVDFDRILHPIVHGNVFHFNEKPLTKKVPVKKFYFKTNQGDLIYDLIYEWFAEYKKQKVEIEQTKQRQTHLYQSTD